MEINLTKKFSELTIQYEVFRRLRELKINCALEYSVRQPSNPKRLIRFDIIVFKSNGSVVCIVETKSYNSNRPANKQTKQFEKYSEFDVPIVYICSPYQIENGVQEIYNMYNLQYNSHNSLNNG